MSDTVQLSKEEVQKFLDELGAALNRLPKREGISMLIQIVVDTAQYTFETPKDVFMQYINELWEASKNPNCVELIANVHGKDGLN